MDHSPSGGSLIFSKIGSLFGFIIGGNSVFGIPMSVFASEFLLRLFAACVIALGTGFFTSLGARMFKYVMRTKAFKYVATRKVFTYVYSILFTTKIKSDGEEKDSEKAA